VPKVELGTPEEQLRPSDVFATRLREIRDDRGFSQAELARRMTEAGRPMSKAALLRIEKGTRGLSLDEAVALAELLGVAPAHMLSPPDDAIVWLTSKSGVDGSGMRNWLLFGDPLLLSPPGQRVTLRLQLVGAIEVYAQAIIDAKKGRDRNGEQHAIRALEAAILNHNTELGKV